MGGRFVCVFFFFNDTATTEIYTLSLHDALPICAAPRASAPAPGRCCHRGSVAWRRYGRARGRPSAPDRKSTRLNSSHSQISYAVFCLKKKKELPVPLSPTTVRKLCAVILGAAQL